jgi:short subunit dehydrogenase-like uncharacterized protein
MTKSNWLLYGATGYTGRLIAAEAVRRGHRPILAGRSASLLQPLATELALEARVLPLDDPAALLRALADVQAVVHAAGPFIHTAAPMVQACLAARAHYLDITGEVPVFEAHFALDAQARQAGISLISGVGFDVIPTDCLARYVAQKLAKPTALELAFAALGGVSAGTTKTMLELLPTGAMVRREGQLRQMRLGAGARTVQFLKRQTWAVPIVWGDLATAYRSTGIPNITTYMAFPRHIVNLLRGAGWLLQGALAVPLMRRVLQNTLGNAMRGPSAERRETAKSYVWARAINTHGDEAQAWLVTPEAYHLTAVMSVLSVERVLTDHPRGALSPAQAFGADFVLQMPGGERYDQLPTA